MVPVDGKPYAYGEAGEAVSRNIYFVPRDTGHRKSSQVHIFDKIYGAEEEPCKSSTSSAALEQTLTRRKAGRPRSLAG